VVVADMGAHILQLDKLAQDLQIPEARQELLQQLVDHVAMQRTCCEKANLIFICTHNSRRSHLAQIWASVAADYFGVENVFCWSGGTESTAMNERVNKSLERSGFEIRSEGKDNPIYRVSHPYSDTPITCFSKRWDDPVNPQEDYAAVLVCAEAEEACPHVPGALARVPLPYIDPKESDGTDVEDATYDERSHQIAREMFWLFNQLRTDEQNLG
jgi:arsenate reductase